jgi:hypothetical protein
MAKANEDAAVVELPLEGERVPEKKQGRHVTVALNHLNRQRDNLLAKRRALDAEIESLDAAILALE